VKRTIVTALSAALIAAPIMAAPKAEAHPLLLAAPFVAHAGIPIVWGVVAGVSGVVFGILADRALSQPIPPPPVVYSYPPVR